MAASSGCRCGAGHTVCAVLVLTLDPFFALRHEHCFRLQGELRCPESDASGWGLCEGDDQKSSDATSRVLSQQACWLLARTLRT